MKKTLVEYDDLYRNSIVSMEKEVRIQYCYDLIDKNQSALAAGGADLPKLKRFELTNIIEAAQRELELLRTESSVKDSKEVKEEESKKNLQ